MNMDDKEYTDDIIESDESDNQFGLAANMIIGLLEFIRRSEVTMFDNEQDLDSHLTHALFYTSTEMYGEEFANKLLAIAKEAIEISLINEEEDEELPVQNAPMTSRLLN